MHYLTPIPKQFVDQSGIPYSGGKVYVYNAGDTTFARIYSSATSDELVSNPFPLDSSGSWQCFVNADEPLDYVVKDAQGNVVSHFEKVVPGGDGSGSDRTTVTSEDGSIDIQESYSEETRTRRFDLAVSDSVVSSARFSETGAHAGPDGTHDYTSLVESRRVGDDIFLRNGRLSLNRGTYHVTVNVLLENGEVDGNYYEAAISVLGISGKALWDNSFVHSESIEVSLDIVVDSDNTAVVPEISGLPSGISCGLSNMDVHKICVGPKGDRGEVGPMPDLDQSVPDNSEATESAPSTAAVFDFAVAGVKVNGTELTKGADKKVDVPVPTASSTTPAMDGVASAGSEEHWAKGDHVHPTDTSREAVSNKVTSWSSTLSDTNYPSEKLVKDTLDNLPPGTAVKGDAESEYRTGNVNLTPANIGAATASQGTKADSAVQGVKVNGTELSKDSNNNVSIPDGTTVQKGVVQLNNAIDSTSTTEAATPKAVKDAYDELNNKIVAISTDTDSSAFDDNTTIATGYGSNKIHLNVASRLWTYIKSKIYGICSPYSKVLFTSDRYMKLASIQKINAACYVTISNPYNGVVIKAELLTQANGTASVRGSIISLPKYAREKYDAASYPTIYACLDSSSTPNMFTFVLDMGSSTANKMRNFIAEFEGVVFSAGEWDYPYGSGSISTISQYGTILNPDYSLNIEDGPFVRYDTASQGLNSTQQGNARTNIGAGTYTKPVNGIPTADIEGVNASTGDASKYMNEKGQFVSPSFDQSVTGASTSTTTAPCTKAVYDYAVPVSSIDLSNTTTDLVTEIKNRVGTNVGYLRFVCKGDGSSANIANKPISQNNSFCCEVFQVRYQSYTDYRYRLRFDSAIYGAYAADLVPSYTTLTWNRMIKLYNHKSATDEYGAADATHYGHVKLDSSLSLESTNPVANNKIPIGFVIKDDNTSVSPSWYKICVISSSSYSNNPCRLCISSRRYFSFYLDILPNQSNNNVGYIRFRQTIDSKADEDDAYFPKIGTTSEIVDNVRKTTAWIKLLSYADVNVSVVGLHSRLAPTITFFKNTGVSAEPTGIVYITPKFLINKATAEQVGSSYQPVYVNSNGEVKPCDYAISVNPGGTPGSDANTLYFC